VHALADVHPGGHVKHIFRLLRLKEYSA
jgi:hypothetical protein